ncbi:MAG: histidine kinase [Gammaproteobacteria bacterium RIFCSPLOWO2_01_FULL_47_190]|nr:MAG: histidine kinase [Gammaproteobacteria bacterium RIFCSPLOWO2_01_FULL_47_190]OGT74577.1 MAG: histidine kinase [Gammaproteobacteria bacterium RIFCSPLOWO2_12_47_11]OGT84667.1 MAG: histidine kinase [Gammaproteobacteria bacterium RIFCSPLOWO2_12_FULL_47_76]
MKIGKVRNREVIVTDKGSNVLEAAKLMRQHHVGSLLVISRESDGNRPVGIITDRDIVVEVLAEEVPLDKIAVEDLMTKSLVVANEDDDLFDTVRKMRVKGVRRIPVVDTKGLLVGIFTMDDLIELLHEELGNIVSLVSREQKMEQKQRP